MSDKKKKDVVINIKPFNLEAIRVNQNSFTLEFWSNIGDDYARRKKVRIELEWWWLGYLFRTVKRAYTKQKQNFLSHGRDAGFED